MGRTPIPDHPPFITAMTLGTLTEHAAQDQQILNHGERLWCWFCYRGQFAVWQADGFMIMRCSAPRACLTYFVGWTDSLVQTGKIKSPQRLNCQCKEGFLKIKSTALKCVKCPTEVPIMPPLRGVAAVIEPLIRQQHKDLGFLKPSPERGPSYHLAFNPDPWQPRVDMPNQVLRRRLALYRRKELEKLEAGIDPMKDLRVMRDVW